MKQIFNIFKLILNLIYLKFTSLMVHFTSGVETTFKRKKHLAGLNTLLQYVYRSKYIFVLLQKIYISY
jgi:hypothetical protein